MLPANDEVVLKSTKRLELIVGAEDIENDEPQRLSVFLKDSRRETPADWKGDGVGSECGLPKRLNSVRSRDQRL